MSRILRRPMFRGGRVSAYGTGIAAPLVPGYQGGGSINEPRRGLVTLPGGYAGNKAPLYNVEDIIGKTQVGGKLSHLKAPIFIPSANEVALNTTGEINEIDTVGEEKEVGKTSFEQLMENNQWGNRDTTKTEEVTIDDKIEAYTRDEGTLVKDLIKFTEKENTYIDSDGIKRSKTTGKPIVKDKSNVNLGTDELEPEIPTDPKDDIIAQLKAQLLAREEKPVVDARTAVAENKALFADLLGIDKARGQDISDMLLGFAGAEGDDTWSKFQSFARDEAKRPGRRRKISDAAGTLAIQDYIAGKKSTDALKLMRAQEDYRPKAKLKALMPNKDDSAQMSLIKFAQINGTDSVNSERTIKDALEFKTKKPVVRNTKIKLDDVENPKKQKNLQIGINIIEKDNIKYYVEWDGTNVDTHTTVEEVWSKY